MLGKLGINNILHKYYEFRYSVKNRKGAQKFRQ